MPDLRVDFYKASPDAVKAMMGLERFITQCGIGHSLLNLIRLRTSQINGCAYCVDMHSQDALKAGETQQRLNTVCVWRETPFFTEQERAVLAWTEAVTLLAQTHVPDDCYQDMLNFFSEKEIVDLTLAIITINGWNRLAVSFRKLP